MSLRVSEGKSAFVQKRKGKEAISSPREVRHKLSTRQNCPLFSVDTFNLQKVSSSSRSLRTTFLNEALRNGNMFFWWHWLKDECWKVFCSLMTVFCVKAKSPVIGMAKFRSIWASASRAFLLGIPGSLQCLPLASRTVTMKWPERMRQIEINWHNNAVYLLEAWSSLPVTGQGWANAQGCC